MKELKQFFVSMQGMEKVSWYILKPIAFIMVLIAFSIL